MNTHLVTFPISLCPMFLQITALHGLLSFLTFSNVYFQEHCFFFPHPFAQNSLLNVFVSLALYETFECLILPAFFPHYLILNFQPSLFDLLASPLSLLHVLSMIFSTFISRTASWLLPQVFHHF